MVIVIKNVDNNYVRKKSKCGLKLNSWLSHRWAAMNFVEDFIWIPTKNLSFYWRPFL
jgi:hypothetical protein